MPFLSSVLERNLHELMKMFLRAVVVDETTTPYKLIKRDFFSLSNYPIYIIKTNKEHTI